MNGHEARDYWEDWGLVLLVTSLLAGPAAWGLHLQTSYALVKWACSREQTYLLALVAAAMFAFTLFGAYLGWQCLAKVRTVATDQGGTIVDRSYFLAVVAIGLNLLLALLIALSAFPLLVLSPCE